MFCIVSEGAASKRFGIDEEREAVPLTLSVAYNKVLNAHADLLHCNCVRFTCHMITAVIVSALFTHDCRWPSVGGVSGYRQTWCAHPLIFTKPAGNLSSLVSDSDSQSQILLMMCPF